jgi:hypothetical protein
MSEQFLKISGPRSQDMFGSRRAPVIQVEDLSAEYSVGRRPAGDWFALGTVRGESVITSSSAWLVVGTGTSEDAAIEHLTVQLRAQREVLGAV